MSSISSSNPNDSSGFNYWKHISDIAFRATDTENDDKRFSPRSKLFCYEKLLPSPRPSSPSINTNSNGSPAVPQINLAQDYTCLPHPILHTNRKRLRDEIIESTKIEISQDVPQHLQSLMRQRGLNEYQLAKQIHKHYSANNLTRIFSGEKNKISEVVAAKINFLFGEAIFDIKTARF